MSTHPDSTGTLAADIVTSPCQVIADVIGVLVNVSIFELKRPRNGRLTVRTYFLLNGRHGVKETHLNCPTRNPITLKALCGPLIWSNFRERDELAGRVRCDPR